MPANATPTHNADNLSRAQRWILLATVSIGVFLITLDNTVLYTVLPRLVSDLDATATEQLWIINAYPVVIAGLLLGTGTLGDKIGHRKMFITGLIVFTLASLVGAFSPSAPLLIAARATLAIGAAIMMPATVSLLRITFTNPKEFNVAISVWATLATVAAALGPIVGGALLEFFWWGSVFLINIPFALTALIITPFVTRADIPHPDKTWDFFSSVLAMITLVSGVLVIKELAHTPQNWMLIALAGTSGTLAAISFVRRQRRLTDPLLTLDIFAHPAFRIGVAGAILVMIAEVGLQYSTTQKLQLVDDFTPLHAGVYATTVAFGALSTSIIAGAILHRVGLRPLAVGGTLIGALGAGLVATSASQPGNHLLIIGLLIVGAGLGVVMALASIAMLSSAPRHRAGMAGSVEEVSYEFGSLLAVTITGSVLTWVYRTTLLLPDAAPARAQESLQDALLSAPDAPRNIAVQTVTAAREAFVHAYGAAAIVITIILLLGAAYMWWELRRFDDSQWDPSAGH